MAPWTVMHSAVRAEQRGLVLTASQGTGHRQFTTTAYPPIHLSHRRPISNAMSCWNLDDRSPALPFPFTSLPVPRWSMDGLPVCDWGCFGIELHALENDCTSPLTRGSFFSSRTMSTEYPVPDYTVPQSSQYTISDMCDVVMKDCGGDHPAL